MKKIKYLFAMQVAILSSLSTAYASSDVSQKLKIYNTGYSSSGIELGQSSGDLPDGNYHVYKGPYNDFQPTWLNSTSENNMAFLARYSAYGMDANGISPLEDGNMGQGFYKSDARSLVSRNATYPYGEIVTADKGKYVYYVEFNVPDKPEQDQYSYSIASSKLGFDINSIDPSVTVRLTKVVPEASKDGQNTYNLAPPLKTIPLTITSSDRSTGVGTHVDLDNIIKYSGTYILSFEVDHQFSHYWPWTGITRKPIGIYIDKMAGTVTYQRGYVIPGNDVTVEIVNNTRRTIHPLIGQFYGAHGHLPNYLGPTVTVNAHSTKDFTFYRHGPRGKMTHSLFQGTWLQNCGISPNSVPTYLDGKPSGSVTGLVSKRYVCAIGSTYHFKKPNDVKKIIYTMSEGMWGGIGHSGDHVSRIDEISTNP